MRVVNFNGGDSGSPNTPEWHAWRQAGIGGSDAGVIAADAGLIKPAPWMKGLQYLFLKKIGKAPPEEVNPAMRRGQMGEVPARRAYERETGNIISPLFGEMDEYPFVRASLDGINFEGDLITEIKCPSDRVHALAKMGTVVDYYKPQLAHQGLVVWGHPDNWRDKMFHYVSYVPEKDELAKPVEIPAQDLGKLAEKLLKAEIQFWKSVAEAIPPCGSEWLAAAAEFIRCDGTLDSAKAARETARKRMVELLGEKDRMEGGGVMAYRSTSDGRIDYKAAFEDLTKQVQLPDGFDIESFRAKGSESVYVKQGGN